MTNPFEDPGRLVDAMEAFIEFYDECYRKGIAPTGKLIRQLMDGKALFESVVVWYDRGTEEEGDEDGPSH